jgi:hypothetical protein
MHLNMQPVHTVYIQFLHTVLLYATTVRKMCMEGCMTGAGRGDAGLVRVCNKEDLIISTWHMCIS